MHFLLTGQAPRLWTASVVPCRPLVPSSTIIKSKVLNDTLVEIGDAPPGQG